MTSQLTHFPYKIRVSTESSNDFSVFTFISSASITFMTALNGITLTFIARESRFSSLFILSKELEGTCLNDLSHVFLLYRAFR